MLWFILLGVSALALIGGLVWYFLDDCSTGAVVSIAAGVVFGLIFGLVVILHPIRELQNINTFERQKAYLETHIAASPVEDAALTTKKIELNGWLYETQYLAQQRPYMLFYPERTLELAPIE